MRLILSDTFERAKILKFSEDVREFLEVFAKNICLPHTMLLGELKLVFDSPMIVCPRHQWWIQRTIESIMKENGYEFNLEIEFYEEGFRLIIS